MLFRENKTTITTQAENLLIVSPHQAKELVVKTPGVRMGKTEACLSSTSTNFLEFLNEWRVGRFIIFSTGGDKK